MALFILTIALAIVTLYLLGQPERKAEILARELEDECSIWAEEVLRMRKCVYYSRSPYLKCTPNPEVACLECTHFEEKKC